MEFAKKVVFVDEAKEQKQIENLDHFVEASKKILKLMKEAGYSNTEIKTYIDEVQLVAVATQRTMIARRVVLKAHPPISESDQVRVSESAELWRTLPRQLAPVSWIKSRASRSSRKSDELVKTW